MDKNVLENSKKVFRLLKIEKRGYDMDIYMYIMCFFYPLFLFNGRIFNLFEMKFFLFYLLTFLVVWKNMDVWDKKNDVIKRKYSIEDIILICSIFALLLKTIVRILLNNTDYELEVFLWSIIILYLFLEKFYWKRIVCYLDMISCSLFLICIATVLNYASGIKLIPGLETLLHDSEASASILLLATCISGGLYFAEKHKLKRCIRWIIFLVCFAAECVYGGMLALCLSILFVLALPLCNIEDEIIIEKEYILLVSLIIVRLGVPLIYSITEWKNFSDIITNRMLYIIFIFCVLGILGYWIVKRIIKSKIWNLEKFKVVYKYLIITIFAISFCGIALTYFEINIGSSVLLNAFLQKLQNSINSNTSFIQTLHVNYGMIGVLFWLTVLIFLVKNIIREWRNAEIIQRVMLMLSVLFIIQTFFYQLQPFSTPTYIIILALAVHFKNSVKNNRQ